MQLEHDIWIAVDGRRLDALDVLEYELDVDVTTPVDQLTLQVPHTVAMRQIVRLDSVIEMDIDGVRQFSGYIDEIADSDAVTLGITARDRIGRLVDESVDGAGLKPGGRLLSEVAAELVGDWFDSITFSNATDRRLRRGGGTKAQAGREPALTRAQARTIPRRIQAGEARWEALLRFLRPLRLITWSSARGDALVIAQPNYAQAPQFRFVESDTRQTVLSMRRRETNQGRYARIEVGGTSRIDDDGLGAEQPRRVIGVAKQGPAEDGTGGAFQRPKRLYVPANARSVDESQAEAERLLAEREAVADTISVTMPGHAQQYSPGAAPTLFAVDTLAEVERWIATSSTNPALVQVLAERRYISGTRFSGNQSRQATEIQLVPMGTPIRF